MAHDLENVTRLQALSLSDDNFSTNISPPRGF